MAQFGGPGRHAQDPKEIEPSYPQRLPWIATDGAHEVAEPTADGRSVPKLGRGQRFPRGDSRQP
jgi:hypothetical protein